jgi:hypothetical protein
MLPTWKKSADGSHEVNVHKNTLRLRNSQSRNALRNLLTLISTFHGCPADLPEAEQHAYAVHALSVAIAPTQGTAVLLSKSDICSLIPANQLEELRRQVLKEYKQELKNPRNVTRACIKTGVGFRQAHTFQKGDTLSPVALLYRHAEPDKPSVLQRSASRLAPGSCTTGKVSGSMISCHESFPSPTRR